MVALFCISHAPSYLSYLIRAARVDAFPDVVCVSALGRSGSSLGVFWSRRIFSCVVMEQFPVVPMAPCPA